MVKIESKIILAIVMISIFCVLAYTIIVSKPPQPAPLTTTTLATTTLATTTTQIIETELSDFQVAACNAADEGGACYTKLPELGIVTPEECCKYLKKCCTPLI